MESIRKKVERWSAILFPPQEIFSRKWSFAQQGGMFILLGAVFYGIGLWVPANGFIAFDWVHFFSQGRIPPFYPPWTVFLAKRLTWPLFFAISMAGISLSIIKRSTHIVSSIAALVSLPVVWTMFLGQLDSLVVLGLLGLPWLVPLVLIKPQVGLFALGAKKSYVLAGIIWIAISIVIWGLWPAKMFAVNVYKEGRYAQDIAIGLAGIIVTLPMFWFSRGDMDMLMISGAFVTPYLIPYNMLPFTPAIARLKPIPALIACLLSWLPFSSNWLGDKGWWLGWLFVVWLWFCLAVTRYGFPNKQLFNKYPKPTRP
ncbi:hypothetical protein [Thermanaerothrix sp.]|jgi:hypothetical protein|uniref:hypothetical protein n=1 Tax=Thermanaerothrix sp. TaxID=2972675 RepID=UPI002ADE5801|nr:hypothetical protein [Thermanaerothrix sp.]